MAVSCFPFFPSSRIFVRVSLEDRVSLRFENIPEFRLRWNYYSFASTNALLKRMSRLIFNAVFKYL